LAAAAGLPEETVRRARRLIGLADPGDERLCRAGEVEMLRAIGNAITLFGEEPALQFTRALGTSTAAIAEAAISVRGLGCRADAGGRRVVGRVRRTCARRRSSSRRLDRRSTS
jgi:hypothetical protein